MIFHVCMYINIELTFKSEKVKATNNYYLQIIIYNVYCVYIKVSDLFIKNMLQIYKKEINDISYFIQLKYF